MIDRGKKRQKTHRAARRECLECMSVMAGGWLKQGEVGFVGNRLEDKACSLWQHSAG